MIFFWKKENIVRIFALALKIATEKFDLRK